VPITPLDLGPAIKYCESKTNLTLDFDKCEIRYEGESFVGNGGSANIIKLKDIAGCMSIKDLADVNPNSCVPCGIGQIKTIEGKDQVVFDKLESVPEDVTSTGLATIGSDGCLYSLNCPSALDPDCEPCEPVEENCKMLLCKNGEITFEEIDEIPVEEVRWNIVAGEDGCPKKVCYASPSLGSCEDGIVADPETGVVGNTTLPAGTNDAFPGSQTATLGECEIVNPTDCKMKVTMTVPALICIITDDDPFYFDVGIYGEIIDGDATFLNGSTTGVGVLPAVYSPNAPNGLNTSAGVATLCFKLEAGESATIEYGALAAPYIGTVTSFASALGYVTAGPQDPNREFVLQPPTYELTPCE